jgi:ankyrin
MPSPQIPLEILLTIARLLTDDGGELCLADFNSFLKVNRALYACLNRALWQEAVRSSSTTEHVFSHLFRTNNLTRLKFFLELGADVETVLSNNKNYTPLQFAARLDNVPIAHLLLEHGANLSRYNHNPYDRPRSSAIHTARSAEMVQLLVDHHADPDQPVSCYGWRPLHYYIERGHIEALRALLRNGVEVNASECSSFTPLLFAAERNVDAVKLLLEYGADVKKKVAGKTLLHWAAKAGKIDVLRLLLDCWPDGISEKNRMLENTPLHLAAERGHTEMVGLLVERWPEGVREKNKWGYTPLHLAAERGHTDAVRLLVERWPEGMRAKTKVVGHLPPHIYNMPLSVHGDTPLHSAARKGHHGVMRVLVEAWPEGIREKNAHGNTPLHLAAQGGKTGVVRLLVESSPEGKLALNKDGQTPLSMFEEHAYPKLKGHELLDEAKENVALLSGVY